MDISTGERWRKRMYKESLELAKQIREEWGKLDVLRDEGLQFPEDVTRIENVSYGNYGIDSLLDIYIKPESVKFS